jgi:putative FmdB family regulatory protein
MPTYQYACPDCSHEFEKVQKFTDNPVKKCPKCGKGKVHRLVGRISVSFKGTGFYINDSKGGSTTSNTKVASSEETPAASETPAKADSTESTESKATPDTPAPAATATTRETSAGSESKTEKKVAKKKKADA